MAPNSTHKAVVTTAWIKLFMAQVRIGYSNTLA